jgi:hypothetical protein
MGSVTIPVEGRSDITQKKTSKTSRQSPAVFLITNFFHIICPLLGEEAKAGNQNQRIDNTGIKYDAYTQAINSQVSPVQS